MKHSLLLLSLLFSLLINAQDVVNYDFVVAKDGSGQYINLQDAINAVPDYRKKTTTIFIKNGVYKEKIVVAESKKMIKLIGENADSTILTYDDYASKKNRFGEEKGTSGSSSFFVYGEDFTAENITFENSSGNVGQAVAILVKADRASFYNCRFLGFQDTLYAYGEPTCSSRQYYQNCYIEGTVDFIFGWATAWFEGCTLFGKSSGYYTAASTAQNVAYGYVFHKCKLTGDGSAGSFYLGRPWRPYSSVSFLECEMGAQVHPEGWHNWGRPDSEKTVRYAEYKNSGLGADTSKRVTWAKQLTDEEAKQFTIQNVMGDWVVSKRVNK